MSPNLRIASQGSQPNHTCVGFTRFVEGSHLALILAFIDVKCTPNHEDNENHPTATYFDSNSQVDPPMSLNQGNMLILAVEWFSIWIPNFPGRRLNLF